jgi:threonylcarbamoyladenosine tRNA methylthiotransferase MtaB
MQHRTFHVANFGCRAAQSEGASIQEELEDGAAVSTDSAFDANVVVINSCTVTGEADRQVRQLIRRVAARNPQAKIIVTGCYAQRAPEELSQLPQVRYVVGNSHKPLVGELARGILDEDFSSHGRAEIVCSSIFLEKELRPARHIGSAGRTRAVVKVQDGCNANCSFCIIPSVRGRSRSMPMAVVLQEVRDLVSRGYKEVIFSGIHLGTYGRDLESKTSLYVLLKAALKIAALERLRLSSIEPLEVTPEIIELVVQARHMAHHFHVPLQSGSPAVLRSMYRPYTAAYYSDLIYRIRRAVPDAAIGADVMVGFPGETDADFSMTYQLIENSALTYLHVFPFSARPDTVAADLPYPVAEHVTRHRVKALRRLSAAKNELFRRSLLGCHIEVLVLDEEPENGMRSAISDNFVRVQVPQEVPVNTWMKVQVSGISEDGLYASNTTTAHEIS